jgi:N6-L-threonylcarbamoyladenine synthase
MRILAIETSADDTCVAIVEAQELTTSSSFRLLGSAIQSQTDIHTEYGGIYPAMAKREHMKNIGPVYEIAMKEAGNPTVDAIAVTIGPGLEPALWVGIVFAKELALKLDVPVIPVNHMEGHIFSSFAHKTEAFEITDNEEVFPILSLLVSGGHTELIVSPSLMEYKKIGQTRDDAVGEAFDKVARMLGLPYPGGPEIGRLAQEARAEDLKPTFTLPRPMMHSKDYDFSYSGLKTAVLYLIRDLHQKNPKYLEVGLPHIIKQEIAREFEDAAFEVLIHKTLRAITEFDIKTLVVGGGVSASSYLREVLTKEVEKLNPHITIHYPAPGLSTDNAVMIGVAGYFQYKQNKFLKEFDTMRADGNLSL